MGFCLSPSSSGASAGSVSIDTGASGDNAPALATNASGLIGWLRKIVDTLAGTLSVSVSNLPATQPISAAALPLPSGAATSANQPALNGDGGALAHITNFPATQPVSLSALPALTAGTNLIGKVGIDQTTPGTTNGVQVTNASIAVTGNFFQATQPISAASLPLPSGAATSAKQPALGTAGAAAADVLSVQGVASMTALKVDGSGVTQPVSLASVPSHPVTNVGTFAVQAAGDVAAAATDSGNPQKIGGVAKTANPTAVTDGQRVNATFDKLGRQVVVLAQRELRKSQQTALTSSTTETTIVSAGGAGVFNDLYALTITNSSATAAVITLRDGTAGTVKGVFAVPAGGCITPICLTAGDAMAQAAAATTWTAQSSASVASIQITALYVQNT